MTVQQAADLTNGSILVNAARICESARGAGVHITLKDALTVIRAAVDGMIDELEQLPAAVQG